MPIIQRRNTAQRKLVLSAVRGRCDHPSADQIYLSVAAVDPRVSRGTVYRNLNVLCDEGEVLHVKLPDGPDRFDLRLEPHCHILCTRCGTVEDADIPYRPELDAEASESTGYQVSRHRTVFEGLCPRCRDAADAAQ
jgi:Fur family ferric uptake transcriptional regulator